jgi:hypothetical protein
MYSSKSADEAALFRQMQPYVLTAQRQELNGFPRPDNYNKDKAIINSKNISQSRSNSGVHLASDKRICDRCSAIYRIDYRGMPLDG